MTALITHPRFPARRSTTRARTWWGKAWVRALEEAAFSEQDLVAARALARSGGVGGIGVGPGEVVAAVADGEDLWSVQWLVPQLAEGDVELFTELVAAQSGRVAALLAGDLPHPLVEEAEGSGVELLPYGGELSSSCGCATWADPCVHALAVAYQVSWLVDADPLVLTALRGLTRDRLLAGVHRQRSADTEPPAWEESDPDSDAALDASLRAARILELLEADPAAAIDHLW